MVAAAQNIDEWERDGTLTPHDANEVRSFSRFLSVVGKPGERNIGRENPGWLPYCLGAGPAPPVGMDTVPLTAWTQPS